MEVDQAPAGVPDGWSVVPPNAAPAAPSGHWEDRPLGQKVWKPDHPVDLNNRADSNILSFPSGAGVSPEDVLIGTQIARKIASAGPSIVGRALAAAKEASPLVKYEAVKTGLRWAHVPEPAAVVIAMAASGYQRGGKTASTAAEAPAAEAARATVPGTSMTPAPMPSSTPGSMAEFAPVSAPVAAPGATAAQTPLRDAELAAKMGGTGNALPDQKALNEAAIAARRAAYQASVAPPAAPASSSNVMAGASALSAEEQTALIDLVRRGVPGPEALKNIIAQRALRQHLQLTIPSAADIRFQKGQRGGPAK